MVDTNQKKAIGKTVGFFCVVFGLVYLSFFIFSLDRTPPVAAIICVAVGLLLLTLSKRR
jgi:lipid-A-disaccharide synthase-like uncharacterized protein